MDDFASSFHAITGTTIGERRKNLFLLLNQTQTQQINLDSSQLQPTTPLEETFKVDALIYFKKIQELIQVLKSENPILVKKVLKAPWFSTEAVRNITGKQLAGSIFPLVSFNVKLKILNKLAACLEDTEKADEMFKSIADKYGAYLASKLLPSCSPHLIMDFLKANTIKLTSRQLLIIIKRHREMTEPLLELTSANYVDVTREHEIIFTYLAHHDAVLYLQLCEKYYFDKPLGWRTTHKFLGANRVDVIKNAEKYYKLLHTKQVPKSLGKDFHTLYLNLFPKSLAQFRQSYGNLLYIIQQLPLSMRDVNLFVRTFEKAYGCELWDHEDYVTVDLLNMVAPEEREKRTKLEKRPTCIEETKWFCYQKTEIAIPFLIKKIVSSNYYMKAQLLALMVETCRINQDAEALAKVCRYVLKRHQSDAEAFLTALKEDYQLENLEEQHWNIVNELINGEPWEKSSAFCEAYIKYRLVHELPIEVQLTNWLKARGNKLNIITNQPRYEKLCLLKFGEIIPRLFEGADFDSSNVQFLTALIQWNRRHHEDQISLGSYPQAIESIKCLVLDEKIESVLMYCIRSKTIAGQTKTELINRYLGTSGLDLRIVRWLLRIDPLVVLNNIDTITKLALNLEHVARTDFWTLFKNYTHLEIPQKITEACLKIIGEAKNDDDMVGKNSVAALSFFMQNDDFLKYAATCPRFQKTICLCLKNLNPPALGLERLQLFYKENCANSTRALYSVLGSINEGKLMDFLNNMPPSAPSSQKHLIHLAFRLFPKEDICNTLNVIELGASVATHKFMLKSVFKFFIKNPDDVFWDLLKSYVKYVDWNHDELFDVLTQTWKIPRDYMVRYILFMWDFFSGAETKRAALIGPLTPSIIQILPRDFSNGIIEHHLFVFDKDRPFALDDGSMTYFQSTVQSYTCRYVIHCNHHSEQLYLDNLKLIFANLKKFTNTAWFKTANGRFRQAAYDYVGFFFKKICSEFLNKTCCNKGFLVKFAEFWNDLFKPHEAFGEYLHLEFTFMYLEKLSLPQLGQRLAQLCDSLTNVYGSIILGIFCRKLMNFIYYFIAETDEVFQQRLCILLESLVGCDRSVACSILVVLLLKKYKSTIAEVDVKFKTIIEVLEKNPEPVVQLYLRNHFMGNINLDSF